MRVDRDVGGDNYDCLHSLARISLIKDVYVCCFSTNISEYLFI